MSAIRALRQLSAVSRPALRAAAAPRIVLARATPLSRVLPATRSFSVTARARGDGSSDLALSHKLAEEIKYEKEAAQDPEPDFLKSFKAQGIWTIEGSTGHDEVTLTRKFGSESVRLMFSIADISSGQQENDFEGMEGEENEVPETEEEPVDSYPIRCSFSVTKSTGEGALTVDAMCQDGAFVIDNVSFYPTAALGTELTAEADWKRRGMYIGPQFDTLDVGVQEEIEKYLAERGMNESLALFIPEFAEFKEQKEYVRWLESVKKFVDQ